MGIVQKIVKWTLNHLPRTFLQRVAGWGVPVLGLWYAGRGRKCPICGKQVREFLQYMYHYFSALPFPQQKAQQLCQLAQDAGSDLESFLTALQGGEG